MLDFYEWVRRFCRYELRVDVMRPRDGVHPQDARRVAHIIRQRREDDDQYRRWASWREGGGRRGHIAAADLPRGYGWGCLDVELAKCHTEEAVAAHVERVRARLGVCESGAEESLLRHLERAVQRLEDMSMTTAVVAGGHPGRFERMAPKIREYGLVPVHWTNIRVPQLPSDCKVVLVFADAIDQPLRRHVTSLARERDVPLLFGESNRWTPFAVALEQHGYKPQIAPQEVEPEPEPDEPEEAPVANPAPKPEPDEEPKYPSWYTPDFRDAVALVRAEMKRADITCLGLTQDSMEFERIEVVRGKL